jgi:predicted aspartyl protease
MTQILSLAFCASMALLCASPAAAQAPQCALASVKISTIPDGRITIPVTLEDHPLSFLVDTGGVSTTLKWEQARALGLAVKQTNRKLTGVGGSLLNFAVASENFSIAALRVRNRPIYIESRALTNADGTLAPDILRSYDVDIDLPRGSLSLMSPDHCAGGTTAIAIDVAQNGHVRFAVKIDGKTIMATLDTGSAISLIGMKAAALLGIYPNAPELTLLRDTGKYRLHAYPFQTLEIGTVTVKNPRIMIASDNFLPGMDSDLVLGIDALRQMHFTIAYGENRLYIAAAQ